MTGTPGEDGGSHADETDSGTRAGETNGGSPRAGRDQRVEGGRGRVPARDRWEGWLARARELWTVALRGAKRLWTAARPVLEQLRWQEMESAPVTLVDRRPAPTLLVPAQGQVYHFVVRTTFTWTSDHARPELFGWYVDQFQPQAMQRLRRIAVRCAAEIPPDQPRAFALALDDAMTGDDALPWAYGRGGVRFTCEPDVSVHLDEPVRELLRPYWDKRIALEWKRDLERRRAEYAEEERKRRPTTAQDDGAGPASGMPEAQDDGAGPTAGMPEAQDDGAGPASGMPEAQDDGTGPTAGMPEALRQDHPPRQREAEADDAGGTGRRPAEQATREAGTEDARRGPRPPDSPVEQWTPLEPFPQPPAPHPAPGQRPASAHQGETTPAPGDPDSPGPA
ncbi:hypothetical protein [Micromonospora sp. NPDC005707]|uniref:hypothetical protein n=1 Tax=Micromonospora sp. NPDC005707 TaxID=3157050 RepID=UPI0033D307B3